MPADFFETHGDELFVIVFRLTFYNHNSIFGGEDENETIESTINRTVHQILLKIIQTPKSESQS